MSTDARQSLLEQAVAAFNSGDLAAFDRLLTPDFYTYSPQPGEPNAPQAFAEVARGLRAAFPDARLSLADVAADGEGLRGRMTLQGTYTGNLWGYPGDGKPHSVSANMVARFAGDRLALAWQDFPLVPFVRELGVVPMPDKAHLKPEIPVRLPEIIVRLAFNGLRLQEKACTHLDQIQVREPADDVCRECVASGDEWPALRMCLVCGYVGCCDLSVNKHMKKHCEATGHPIIRSIAPGESWLWCYPDAAFLSSVHLHG